MLSPGKSEESSPYERWRDSQILAGVRGGAALLLALVVIWTPLDYFIRPAATFHELLILFCSEVGSGLAGIWLSRREFACQRAPLLAIGVLGVLAIQVATYCVIVGTEPELMAIGFTGLIFATGMLVPWGLLRQGLFVAFVTALFAAALIAKGGLMPRTAMILLAMLVMDGLACYFSWVLAKAHSSLFDRNAQLESAMRYKSDLLQALSHDLRSPLHVQIGYLELLQEGALGKLNSEQAHAVERALFSANQQMKLMGDLLDVSRIEADKLEVRIEEVELRPMVEEVATTARHLLGGKQVEVVVQLEAPRAMADPHRLRQVLENLVGNAVKFTSRGRILIATCPAGDGRARVSVSDSGVGIDSRRMEQLFEPFSSRRPLQGDPGTGLGLSIARRLAEAMGAALKVDSQVGRGTTVELLLPTPAQAS